MGPTSVCPSFGSCVASRIYGSCLASRIYGSCPRFINRQLCLRLLSRHSHLRFAPRQSSLVSTSPVRVSPVVSETASIDKEISKLVQTTKNWFRIKLQIMIDFTELKFEQCQQFQKYLLGTQNRKLIHNVQDKY